MTNDPSNPTRTTEAAAAIPKPRTHELTGITFVHMPPAEFLMGSEEGGTFERPVHRVRLEAHWVGRTTVTNEQFAHFVAHTGYVTSAEQRGRALAFVDGRFQETDGVSWRTFATPDRQEHPVILVSWEDANAFCQWSGLRLPTEAEWERAARAGAEGMDYPWGQAEPDQAAVAFSRTWNDAPPTVPADSGDPNALGLHHMVGNVWQWCSDWYAPYADAPGAATAPRGAESGEHRVRRGGSWNVIQSFRLRCSNRGAMGPDQAAPNVGFRCCADSLEAGQ